MKIQQIRNATIIVEYAGKKILIDPMLAARGTYPAFSNAPREDQKNPLVDLPISLAEITQDLDAVIVTHLHLDHWDDAAKNALPKEINMFVQNEEDAAVIQSSGFQNVMVLEENTVWEGIQLIKTKGEHGRGEILKKVGQVCGVVFKHSTEKTLYIAGDTVWYDKVQETIDTHNPEAVIVNAGDNQFFVGGSLVMGKDDVYKVHKAAPTSKIIAVHMEAVNHWALSREELKEYAKDKDFSSYLLVPEDGESYSL